MKGLGLGSLLAIGLLAGCGGSVATESSNDPNLPDPTPPGQSTPEPTAEPTSAPVTNANLTIGNWFVSQSAAAPSDAYEPNDTSAKFLGGPGFVYTMTQGKIEPIEAIVTAEVMNAGDGDATAFAADLYFDKTAPPAANERGVLTQAIPALPAGASTTITFAIKGGAQPLTKKAAVKADAAGALTEPDETDNFSPNVDVMLPKADEDWFSFDEDAGYSVVVKLTNLPADYDVELYNAAGAKLAQSLTDGTANEQINFTP